MLLAGFLGAGLTARAVSELKVEDILIDDDGVVLRVGDPRAREVPVLAEYEHVFIDAGRGLNPEDYVFRPGRVKANKNTATNFVRNGPPSRTVVTPQRARSTWINCLLRNGVQIDAVMEAMGVTDFSAIARYLRYVPKLDRATYRAAIRDAGRDHGSAR